MKLDLSVLRAREVTSHKRSLVSPLVHKTVSERLTTSRALWAERFLE